VSTIQGNFLSPEIQDEVRAYVRDPDLGRPRKQISSKAEEGLTEEELDNIEQGYIDMERHAHLDGVETETIGQPAERTEQDEVPRVKLSLKERDMQQGRAVDVVLSDMSEPWDQTAGFYKKSLSDPYFRMMNTSGNAFRDHAGSMVGPSIRLAWIMLTRSGSLYGCDDIRVRHTEDWWSLSMQVLPRVGGEGLRDQTQASLCESSSGEA
jgi:23S rRNA U2552 (ribose-2'-O)-methylase RlmE/FtsJ